MYHKPGGLNNRNLLSHSSGYYKSEIILSARLVSSEGFEGKLCSTISLWLGNVYLLSVSLHIVFPQCVPVSKFPLLITVILDYGPP